MMCWMAMVNHYSESVSTAPRRVRSTHHPLRCLDQIWDRGIHRFQSLALRSRSALAMTETELKLIAAPAMMGLSSTPKNG